MQQYELRPLRQEDDSAIARVIRQTLEEFGAARPGTVYTDPTTDHLSQLFNRPDAAYFVIEEAGTILGGCGIFPTEGLPNGCTELVKLYLRTDARGKGLGRKLMEHCIEAARRMGFNKLYLESMPELNQAVALYEKMGFVRQCAPLGNSGHFTCSIWMTRSIDEPNLGNV